MLKLKREFFFMCKCQLGRKAKTTLAVTTNLIQFLNLCFTLKIKDFFLQIIALGVGGNALLQNFNPPSSESVIAPPRIYNIHCVQCLHQNFIYQIVPSNFVCRLNFFLLLELFMLNSDGY